MNDVMVAIKSCANTAAGPDHLSFSTNTKIIPFVKFPLLEILLDMYCIRDTGYVLTLIFACVCFVRRLGSI